MDVKRDIAWVTATVETKEKHGYTSVILGFRYFLGTVGPKKWVTS